MILRDSTADVLALLAESGLALTPHTIAKNIDPRPPIARKRCESLLNAEYVVEEEAWDRTFYRITKLGRGRLLMRQREIMIESDLGPDEQVRLFLDILESIDEADEPPTVADIVAMTEAEEPFISEMLEELRTEALVEAEGSGTDARYTTTIKAHRVVLAYD